MVGKVKLESFRQWKQVGIACFITVAIPASAEVGIHIYPAIEKWTISPYLVGAHTVYYSDPDAAYTNGKVADWCRQVGVGTMRFPGGSVVKYWDWEHPSGTATGDPWDPDWDGITASSNDWMSLDEYLDFCDRSSIKPLVGVNYRSGYLYNRVQDSIDRAARCVQHVVDRGYPGAFYYIGNEDMYEVGGLTSSANLFVQHAQAMKAVDPTIKIFWNDNDADPQKMKDYLTLVGAWADGFEFHGKWPFGGTPTPSPSAGTYEEWKTEVPLIDRKANNNAGKTWRQKLADLKAAAVEAGRPDLLLSDNEYGWGDGSNFSGFNKYTSGLMMTDFLQEHFISGYDTACFWANIRGADTGLLDRSQSYRRNPQALGWELLAGAQGAAMVEFTSSHAYVYGFTARTGTNILVYLLNKTETNQPVSFVFQGMQPDSSYAPQGIAMVDTADHWGTNQVVSVLYDSSAGIYSAMLPAMSYNLIRFIRSANEPPFFADFDSAATNAAVIPMGLNSGTAWGSWSGALSVGKMSIRASGANHAVMIDRNSGEFALDASLITPCSLDGLAVSFKIALRRTGVGKNITILGLDSDGNKSFSIEIDSSALSLGYSDPLSGLVTIPEGNNGDFSFMGDIFNPDALREVTLYLYNSGYRVCYAGGAWVSGDIPYNGMASELAQINFSGNDQAGVWLDDVSVISDPDRDADGLPDHFEIRYSNSPTNTIADADDDHDGLNNRAEYVAGTDPLDPSSCLKVFGGELNGKLSMAWSSVSGRMYSVYSTIDLAQPFTLVQRNLLYFQNVYTAEVDSATSRFFRIETQLP